MDLRYSIYELFANVFAKEATPQFLRFFQSDKNKKTLNALGIHPFCQIENLPFSEQADILAVEFTNLFLLPNRPTLPYESLHRGEKTLWGDTTVEVNNLYITFGFEVDAQFHYPPDHLSAELSFLANLCSLEEKFDKDGLLDAKYGVREVKKELLEKHLLKWFPRFQREVEKLARYCYYKEMLRWLSMVLAEELLHLLDEEGKRN